MSSVIQRPFTNESPSSRRAWIEIRAANGTSVSKKVALLAEGVDRNFFENCLFAKICKSPSSRRAWIEITSISVAFAFFRVALLAEGVDRNLSWLTPRACCCPSPSSRRAWIEILGYSSGLLPSTSPSSRRAWIEIAMLPPRSLFAPVALLAEGVDRNIRCVNTITPSMCRPPRRGRG